jgi:hypothetical protein
VRTLFIGDVHGCADSLRALIAEARPDRVVLLGDLFNKGPDPAGVWDVIRETGAESVLGNHDERMLQRWGTPGDSSHHAAVRTLPDEAREWLAGLPLFLHGDGWLAVHAGVHPFEGEAGTTRKMALTMRRWPDDENPSNPFWWHLYRGDTRVIYGHDAIRGLQKHARTIGLDTGACYGNVLSGYLLEEDRVYEVRGAVTGPPRAAAR